MPSVALLQRGPAGPGVRVDDRKVDLRLVGIEVEEELIDLIDHLADPSIGPIDLVHHQDHRQLGLERLAEHEARLGEGPLGGVDEEQHPIDHRQPALDLPTEVRMPGRVDDVELGLPVPNGRVLGEDRDPLLPLEIGGVHDPLGDVLAGPKRAGLPEHGVDERRLAMVDVGDDGDVAEVGAAGHGARDGRDCAARHVEGNARSESRQAASGMWACRRPSQGHDPSRLHPERSSSSRSSSPSPRRRSRAREPDPAPSERCPSRPRIPRRSREPEKEPARSGS